MFTGTLTIAAAVDDGGVRLYTKLADGSVVVEHNPTTQGQIQAAQRSGDQSIMQSVRPWYRQAGDFNCDPGSALAAYIWNGNVAIFHEHRGQIKFWLDDRSIAANEKRVSESRTDIPLPKDPKRQCMHGTKLAVTGDDNAKKITLFYQDEEGYLCYRYANSMVWDEPVTLQKAAEGTDIAAIGWNANKAIRVYFQDESYNILEYALINNAWRPAYAGIGTAQLEDLTTISAIQWFGDGTQQIELRVYFQLGQSSIQEWCYSKGSGWYKGATLFNAFVADFNILAFCRGDPDKPVLNVWIASKDGRVLLRSADNDYARSGWFPAIGHALPLTDYQDS